MGCWSLAFLALGWAVVLSEEDRDLWRGRLIDPILGRLRRKGGA